MPSLRLQTNNKHENLKFVYQTQHNVYNNQKEMPVALKERDGLPGGNNDDMSGSGDQSDDNDDDGQDDQISGHHQDTHDEDNLLSSQNNGQRSIYDWDLDGKDSTPAQRSTWFDNTPDLAKFTTLTHEHFFKNNVSLSQLFHSEGLNIGLPHSHQIPIRDNTQIYQSLLEKSSSLGALLARTIYQYINPLIWVAKTKLKMQNEKVPIFDLQGKFQMAWHFLVLNSQKLHPPSQMQTSHEIL